MRQGKPNTWRIGAGLSLLTAAHLEQSSGHLGIWMQDLEFGVLRLAGLGVVLLVLLRPASRRARFLRAMRREDTGGIAMSAGSGGRAAREVAERNHEIRNVLSGLAGVGCLLGARADRLDAAQWQELAGAMQTELDRLRELLEESFPPRDSASEVGPVVNRLAAIHRVRGMRIELALQPGLRAAMPATELAQVLTNLLANCDRHAPGASVRIGTNAESGFVRITVADDGPGLSPPEIACVLGGEQFDASAGGSGIGLRICRRLLHARGGHVRLRSHGRGKGCTVEVLAPEAGPVSRPLPRTA